MRALESGFCCKVETSIHDSIRELITWEWKEHGVKHHECVSKSKRKCWALESDFLEAWAILHKYLKQGCCRHLFFTHRCIQMKQRNNCEGTQMMVRKVHVYFKNWEFHLVTLPKCQKLPSSIPKTVHVKFRATSSSLSTTLWCYYRGQN
jgi:hypothetical protein